MFFRIVLMLYALISMAASADESEVDRAAIEQGRYLFDAANCYACHTDVDNDGAPLAGGRALESDFGIFFSPNITPDKDTGIGNWSDEDFIRALILGIAPDGHHYYPSFPYLSYQNMNREDILAIKAYLFSQPAVSQKNKPHQLAWYLSGFTLRIWKLLNDLAAMPVTYDGSRGSYLVDVLGHCNECHTPRNMLGMLKMQNRLEGNKALSAPDISTSKNGIGGWDKQELADLFRYGELPDGDYVADHMGEVVDNSTSKWADYDLQAVIEYLQR
ncbi:MAG: cytochrome c [Thiotrichales bacterium]|nr:MAG: cytochrome c [Thiotrichales bacterium]